MSDPVNEAADTTPSLDGRDITEEEVFTAHEGGKLSVAPTIGLAGRRDLAIAYTPGVAKVCRAIADDKALTARYTWTHRLVAVVSDGTAVLGLGDIGPRASLPVMEGKSALFKAFADLDSIPLVLETTDVDEIVDTIVHLRPSFGAVNLEDIAAPRCFEIERRLIEALDCPVMHDDQHGTAIVVLAALRNAARVLDRDLAGLKVVVSGAGASGVACAKILLSAGAHDVVVLDSRGVIHAGRDGMNVEKMALAEITNPRGVRGDLAAAVDGADVFLGLSGSTVPESVIASMAEGGVVLALSNPDPEIDPAVARKHAAVVATGRSDYPNQINNVLAFPGFFRGLLDAQSHEIRPEMLVAAARALADVVEEDELNANFIVPSVFDPEVASNVAAAVKNVATAGK